ncbi:MAG: hypothetical protein H6618_09170 [Deltaproteobacteria bacterium]|nr:hypothetical protein [Deltaproteobacteria bacterium]
MDTSLRPKKPVVVSHLSADILSRYRQQIQSRKIQDADGLTWKLSVVQQQRPSVSDPEQLRWLLVLSLCCEADADLFVQSGTLDQEKDQRLIDMLRSRGQPVKICVKPLIVEGVSEEQMFRKGRTLLPAYEDKVRGQSLHAMKRQVICQLIDKQHLFSSGI